jgi:anti-sigma regulatory factor (Ser/Thr protein kinase)
VALVLQEALSNSVIHGNLEISSDLKEREGQAFLQALVARAAEPDFASRSVEVLVQYDGAQCQWIITDEGQGFPVEKVLGEDHGAEPALIRCSGRGIILMRLDGWRAL